MSAALRHLELPGLQLQGRPGPYLGRRHPKLAFQWESFPAHSSSSTAASSCSRAPPSQGLPFFGSRHRPGQAAHLDLVRGRRTNAGTSGRLSAKLQAGQQRGRGTSGQAARRAPRHLEVGSWWAAGRRQYTASQAGLGLCEPAEQRPPWPGRPRPPAASHVGLGGRPRGGAGPLDPMHGALALSLSPSLSLPPALWEAWAGSWGPARVGSIG